MSGYLIVDDSRQFLEVARELLERQGLRVVGVASSSADALRQTAALRPAVVLVDIFLGDESGLDLARRLVDAGAVVLLISSHSEADVEDLVAGSPAVGFLTKTELTAEAIRRIVDGRPERPSGRRGT